MLTLPFFRSLPFYGIISLIAIITVDRLFYDSTPGWIIGLSLIGGAALVYVRHPHLVQDRIGLFLFSLLIPISASCFYSVGILAPLLGVTLLIICTWWARGARYQDTTQWLKALIHLPSILFAQVHHDRRLLKSWRLVHNTRIPDGRLLIWIVPLLLGILFLIIFAVANPIISQWFSQLGTWLSSYLTPERWLPTPLQIVLWWSIGALSWYILRVHAPRIPAVRRAIPAQETNRNSLILRSLCVVNAVFALQLSLDLSYLVGGLQLPDGMTYATYAHRGAYPLLVAALLSAALVLIAFRPHGAAQRSVLARRLVFIWLGQNVFLTIAAAWRLWLYIDAYGLSEWRLSAAIWMGLVAVGLLLIGVRIAREQNNRWLIDANAFAVACVLLLSCWLNVGSTVAWHNVYHCKEVGGNGVAIDLDYLETFNEEVAPALLWLAQHSQDEDVAKRATAMARVRQEKSQLLLSDWRSWTWVRAEVASLPEQLIIEARK